MQRRKISPEKKVEIIREVLENRKSISEVADKYDVHPNLIAKWKKQFFEQAIDIFKKTKEPKSTKQDKKIKKLEETLQKRDTLIAELVSENIDLKKNEDGDV
jgi:transposase-like protein